MVQWKPLVLNFELTTACPLRCPQCYCTLEGGRHMDLDLAKHYVDQAVELGTKYLNLSGGETLCYPYLYELIRYASPKMKEVSVSLSGAFFNQQTYEKLASAGVHNICVSLNGSTPEINALTRDGYDLAIRALALLQENRFDHVILNWVMHNNNVDDFPNIVALAERYGVFMIDVMGLKPDAALDMKTFPSKEQIIAISSFIRKYRGGIRIAVETCYSPFAALHMQTKLFGNMNVGEQKGCSAGRTAMSVTVDGTFTPCRHVMIQEHFPDMATYWHQSATLMKLRGLDDLRREPCSSCKYQDNCRHCQAISMASSSDLYLGFQGCPVYEPREEVTQEATGIA